MAQPTVTKFNSALLLNRNNVIARSAGTANTAFIATPISRPRSMDAQSSNNINQMIAQISGVNYSTLVQSLGSVKDITRLIDQSIGNQQNINIVQSDGLNQKTSDLNPNTTGYIQSRYGYYYDANGFRRTPAATTINYPVNSASGDRASKSGRTNSAYFFYAMGASRSTKSIALPTT